MPYTPEQVKALADAMLQLLDDMGFDGKCVCGFAKAEARVAYEPFRSVDDECDMPLEVAQQIIAACNG